MTSGAIPTALAINISPFGHGRDNAFDSVEEDKPAAREVAASVVPLLRKAAMMSAGCQSG